MIPAVERVEPPSDASFKSFRRMQDVYGFDWHHHVEVELTWIEHGGGRRFVGDHATNYQDGDLVLIGGWLPHTWASDAPTGDAQPQQATVVQFTEAWLTTVANTAAELRPVGRMLQRAKRGLFFPTVSSSVIASLRTIGTPARRADSGARLLALLSVLNALAHAAAVPLASAAYAADPPPADPRIARALRYAGESFVQGVSQSEAARLANLSPEAFSRLFHRHTGRTFQRHVHDLRIGRACRLLQESTRSITDICFDSGFGNVANFNRVFRRLVGTTPRAYRDRFEAG